MGSTHAGVALVTSVILTGLWALYGECAVDKFCKREQHSFRSGSCCGCRIDVVWLNLIHFWSDYLRSPAKWLCPWQWQVIVTVIVWRQRRSWWRWSELDDDDDDDNDDDDMMMMMSRIYFPENCFKSVPQKFEIATHSRFCTSAPMSEASGAAVHISYAGKISIRLTASVCNWTTLPCALATIVLCRTWLIKIHDCVPCSFILHLLCVCSVSKCFVANCRPRISLMRAGNSQPEFALSFSTREGGLLRRIILSKSCAAIAI